MKKISFKPGTMLAPLPVVMASLGQTPDEYNIITIAWTGIINSEPPMTYLSVRKSRHSHSLLLKNREYVINLPSENLTFATDFCGVRSGKDVNKFETQKLTPIPAEIVKAPMIEECPINIECKVVDVISYPSHDMFVSEILKVHANQDLLDEKGRLQIERAHLISYVHGEYYGQKTKRLGSFGYSVMKPKTKKRKALEAKKKKK
jgi:flavin reductase (DIM6/NTAB) family NADH-FMN oxidoreductase RutF